MGSWQPSEDELTAYDHRHKLLREFKTGNAPNIRNVAESLRPVLEGYLRVAFPEFAARRRHSSVVSASESRARSTPAMLSWTLTD